MTPEGSTLGPHEAKDETKLKDDARSIHTVGKEAAAVGRLLPPAVLLVRLTPAESPSSRLPELGTAMLQPAPYM
jgi:hypothetical protein